MDSACSFQLFLYYFRDTNGSSIKLVPSGGPQKSYQSTQDTSTQPCNDGTLSTQKDKEISFCNKMYLFYAKTPAVKFYLNLVGKFLPRAFSKSKGSIELFNCRIDRSQLNLHYLFVSISIDT